MAKQQILSLATLKSLKPGQQMPGMHEIRDWLINEHGFSFRGDDRDNLFAPSNSLPTPLYLSEQFSVIKQASLNAVIKALDVLQAEQDAASFMPAATVAGPIRAMIDSVDRFSYHLEGDMLKVSAKEYPELHFTVPYLGSDEAIGAALKSQLDYYNGEDGEYSLGKYKKALRDAADYGLERRVINGQALLVSLLDTTPSLPLTGDPHELTPLVINRAASNALQLAEQYELIDELKTKYGFTTAELKNETLTLSHPNLPNSITLPTHGGLGYLASEDWRQLLDIITEVKKTPLPPEEPKAPPPPLEQPTVRRVQVKPPEKDDTLLVFDAGAFFDLSKARGSSPEETWFELLEHTKKLPGIGKIIIPDYIADVEMRNQVCAYNAKGEPEFIDLPPTSEQPPEAFREFIKHAVRRHVKDNGEVEYLAEPGSDTKDTKIIIWETNEGRKRAVEMANAMRTGGYLHRERNFGEKQISQLIAHELDWKNPVNVITNDLRYIHQEKPPTTTRTGQLVSYNTTYDYMEGEFTARGNELKGELRLPKNTTAREHYQKILGASGAWNDNLLETHTEGGDEALGIIAVISSAVKKSKAPKAPATTKVSVPIAPAKLMEAIGKPIVVSAAETTTEEPRQEATEIPTSEVIEPAKEPEIPKAPVEFAKVHHISFGGILKRNLHAMEPAVISTKIKENLKIDRKNLQKKTIERVLREEGDNHRSDVLYRMLEQLDALALAQGSTEVPSQVVFALEDPSQSALADAVMQQFSTLLPDTKAQETFLLQVVKDSNVAAHAAYRLGPKTVEKIMNNEELPEVNVAAAIRDLLRQEHPNAVHNYDRAYFAARVKATQEAQQSNQRT